MSQKLSFLPRGTDRFQDLEAMDAGILRYVGWYAIDKDGAPTTVIGSLVGWKMKTEPQTVPFRHEYARAARDGSFWCADKATADACGVEFDPSFGTAPKKDDKKGDSK